MEKKYVVIADYVISKNDGDRHFITCNQLVKLYGVREEECIFMESSIRGKHWPPLGYYYLRHGPLIELRPRYHGNYNMPMETIK